MKRIGAKAPIREWCPREQTEMTTADVGNECVLNGLDALAELAEGV